MRVCVCACAHPCTRPLHVLMGGQLLWLWQGRQGTQLHGKVCVHAHTHTRMYMPVRQR